jgi:hypothetical protein
MGKQEALMKDQHNSRKQRISGVALIATACGAVAVGAFAIGALAVGRLAIGCLTIDSAKLKSLEIGDLTVKRLRAAEIAVSDSLELPESGACPRIPS